MAETTSMPDWMHVILAACPNPESRTQPAPRQGGEDVAPRLLEWINGPLSEMRGGADLHLWSLIVQRTALGYLRYGTVLQTHNGRDPVEDGRQELGDALKYIEQAIMQGEDLTPLIDVWQAIGIRMGLIRPGLVLAGE